MAASGEKPRPGIRPRTAGATRRSGRGAAAADDVPAWDNPESAQGAAAGDDDFGVRLSWPEEVPARARLRRPPRTADNDSVIADTRRDRTGSSSGPTAAVPVLPELAARVEKVQKLVSSVVSQVDVHHSDTLAAIEALSARLDQMPESAGLDPDAIGGLEGGIDALASDIAELRTEVGQLKRRGAATAQLSEEVVQLNGAIAQLGDEIAQLGGEIAELNAELVHVKRRLPVRAKEESDAALVEAIVATLHERLGSDLGPQIAEVVVGRLFDVVEVVEIDEPPPRPKARPVPAAKRRPGQRPTPGTTPRTTGRR